jgi:hypothetical protein
VLGASAAVLALPFALVACTTSSDASQPVQSTSTSAGGGVVTGGPTVTRDPLPDGAGVPTVQPDGTDPPDDPFDLPGYRLSQEAFSDGEAVAGSGCSPSNAEVLDDGLWFGYINRLEGGVVSFDLMCYHVGDLAGLPGCEVDLDSCVVNESTVERPIPLADDTVFSLPRQYDSLPINDQVSFAEFAVWLGEPGNSVPLWIDVDGGVVKEIEANQLLAG